MEICKFSMIFCQKPPIFKWWFTNLLVFSRERKCVPPTEVPWKIPCASTLLIKSRTRVSVRERVGSQWGVGIDGMIADTWYKLIHLLQILIPFFYLFLRSSPEQAQAQQVPWASKPWWLRSKWPNHSQQSVESTTSGGWSRWWDWPGNGKGHAGDQSDMLKSRTTLKERWKMDCNDSTGESHEGISIYC